MQSTMNAPTPLETAALDALRTVTDPLTGQDWVSTRHLQSLTVDHPTVLPQSDRALASE